MVPLRAADLGRGIGAWFTGAPTEEHDPEVGRAGNLSHRRPHMPGRLARDRRDVLARAGLAPDDLHLMRQVHGAAVGRVTATTTRGAELRDVDAIVTDVPGRALGVLVADCLPVLLAGGAAVAAVHVGRRGLMAGVLAAAADAVRELADGGSLRAVIGPAIGGCCYEVPAAMRDDVSARHPAAAAATTWGTPSLDLVAGATAWLEDQGIQVGWVGPCTRCTEGWFSHRRDPAAGRQLGLVVRREAA